MPHTAAGRASILALATGLFLAFVTPTAAQDPRNETRKERRERRAALAAAEEALPLEFKQFLADVHFLISDDEREAFLEVTQDYQRRAWIERFWRLRDPYPDTPRNELRVRWEERLLLAEQEFERPRGDRARMFMLNGEPDGRVEFRCTTVTWPIEIWYYGRDNRTGQEFYLLFVRRYGQPVYELWHPADGIDRLLDVGVGEQALVAEVQGCKDSGAFFAALNWLMRSRGMEFSILLAKLLEPIEAPSSEWTLTFEAYSTDLPEGVERLDATLELRYPARYQARTVMEALIEIDPALGQPQHLRRPVELRLLPHRRGSAWGRTVRELSLPVRPSARRRRRGGRRSRRTADPALLRAPAQARRLRARGQDRGSERRPLRPTPADP